MSEQHRDADIEDGAGSESPDTVAIESNLPLTAIDIESEKDMESGRYHKLRSLFKWFAARPTPAVRLSILASVYPGEFDSDELLRLMQIGPKALQSDIAEFVEKKYAEPKGSGTLDDHYGYPNPNTQSPTESQIESLHSTLRDAWGGELPTIVDPTAGRGIIPFEAMRYGLPVKANELNPVPSLVIKTALKYVPQVGSVESEFEEWRSRIHTEAKSNISDYYPTEEPGRTILNAASTYLIQCDSCGGEIPLVMKWWLHNSSSGGHAVRPIYEGGSVEYEYVNFDKNPDVDYDPSSGPLSRGSAECPHCGVVNEQGEIKSKLKHGEFQYSIWGVNYEDENGDWKFRAGSEVDQEGMEAAAERVDSDFEMLSFLTEPIDVSSRKSDPTQYGMDEWRDIYTPRQLVVHYEYLKAFEKFKPQIVDKYDDEKAEAILTLLAMSSAISVTYSSRLTQWRDSRGYGSHLFSNNEFSLKRMFVDNNLTAERRGYVARSEHVIDSYEELVSYSPSDSAEVLSADAATLTDYWEEGSADVAIVDPPYYSSIMYAELSDVLYTILRAYLGDTFPYLFSDKLTNKDDEAVANPSRFKDIAGDGKSKRKLADDFYEQKMQEIFSETHKLLDDNGVMTVMFTHREMDAWDTLTTALLNAGFVVSATLPVKTEMGDRTVSQGRASANSSIFLVARKRKKSEGGSTTLWESIKSDISRVAKEEAERILNSGYTISKTDTAISAYGPTLRRFAEEYPVVDKKGESVAPRRALEEARTAVTSVLAEQFLETDGIEQLDSLTRWYVLAWLIYENDTFPFDEGLQLGVAAGIDVEDVKRATKIWGKSGSDMQLKSHGDRLQDIVMLLDADADDPSSRKYPVNPTDTRFTYTIDTLHAALHVYERQGPGAAWTWLTERSLKSDQKFKTTIAALLEVLPEGADMRETLINLVSGETGDYLDINLSHIDMSGVERQTELGDHST